MSERLESEKASKYATIDDSFEMVSSADAGLLNQAKAICPLELDEMKRSLRAMCHKVGEPYPPSIVKSSGSVGRRTIW
jgi:hypothetical protein